MAQPSQAIEAIPPRLILSIVLLTTARLVVNVVRRFTYPFVPAISRELNVSQTSIQGIIGLQAGIGITSPMFGPVVERYGRKRMMVVVLFIMAGTAGVGALLPQFGVFALVMIAFGMGKMIFDAAMLAYIGDRVHYGRRGMALGIAELSWAGSFIVSSLLVGWLLEVSTLRAVLIVMGVALATVGVVVAAAVPSDRPDGHQSPNAPVISLADVFHLIRRSPAALGAIGYLFAHSVANEILFINYGAFMEKSFGLSLVALGAATIVIPVAEALGELLVIGISDRFGKRRLVLIGAAVASLMYFLLPHLTSALGLAQAGLFLMFLATETSIVASLALFTEIMPDTRSILLSALIGAAALGRLTGSLIGGFLYGATGSFLLLGIVSFCIGLSGLGLVWRFVKEKNHQRR